MTIRAKYAGRIVEVHDVFTGSNGRRIAEVELIEGKPFKAWTHGGEVTSNFAMAPIDLIHLTQEECTCETVNGRCPACEFGETINCADASDWIEKHAYDHAKS